MKYYKFTDEQNTWWVEYRVDGMQNSDKQTIVSIMSKDTNGVINNTDLHDFMVVLGLPNKVGSRYTHTEAVALAEAKSLRLFVSYESSAEVALRTSTSKDFLAFSFPEQGQVGDAVIDTENETIVVNVEEATDVSSLTPTWEVPFGAFVTDSLSNDLESGEDELDFTNPVDLVVYSETPLDSKIFEVTVNSLKDDALITGFVLDEQTGAATINNEAGTIVIEVVALTDITDLVPTITISAGATISPLTGISQDFTEPVVYTVTSEDLTVEKEYTVTVTVAE